MPMPITTAARPMGTGISRAGLGLAGTVLAIAVAGCGGGNSNAFGWLHAQAPPAGWKLATIPSGATMAFPPSWRRVHGDPGTATAVLVGSERRFLGYINLTPHQGAETLSNWSSFRVEHNADEGDRHIKRLASASGLRFRTGRGSCIKDSYSTEIGARYIEIACLVSGAGRQTVIVAAAPPRAWSRESAVLERAIEAVRG